MLVVSLCLIPTCYAVARFKIGLRFFNSGGIAYKIWLAFWYNSDLLVFRSLMASVKRKIFAHGRDTSRYRSVILRSYVFAYHKHGFALFQIRRDSEVCWISINFSRALDPFAKLPQVLTIFGP